MSSVRYEQSVTQAHEAALREDLHVMRQAIQELHCWIKKLSALEFAG